MASMSSSASSSKFFGGTTQQTAADHMELMMNNSQQDLNPISSMFPTRVEQDPEGYLLMELSATTILDSNKHICEVCFKGFARKQNLTLHRRSHNLPYSLKTRTPNDSVLKKMYLCPEPTCRRNHPAHALGDFGGLKKHYLRKHCDERNYKCDTCDKAYTVETDLRAHLKTCSKKMYICHCGARFSRGYKFTVHQENCEATPHDGAAKHPSTLYMGDDGSVKTTRNYNRRDIIGSRAAPPPTFGLRDNSIGMPTNENINTFIGSNFLSIANPSANSYQSQLSQFGSHFGSHMTNPFSMTENPDPAFFSPLPTQQNQHGIHESSDTRFYVDLLTGKIPLNSVNPENMNTMGQGRNIYGTEEDSNLFSGGGFTLDHSGPLYSTPAVHNTGLNTGMLNTVSGYNAVGSSSINHNVRGSNDPFGYHGYANGFSSGHFDYDGGREAFNFVTSAATAGVVAPSGEHFNQRGFWF